ncbi:MAG: CD225/dispanin family protein [Pseudoxanthomonas sp.]
MSTIPPPPPADPGYLPPAAPPPAAIPNHLAWAIIATVLGTCFCCPLGLLGIVAIVYASKVNKLLVAGDFAGAQRASASAKTWCWVATALAIIGLAWSIYSFTSGRSAAQYQQIMQIIESRQHS